MDSGQTIPQSHADAAPGAAASAPSSPSSLPHPHSAIQRAALLVATLASFLTPFAGSSTNVALPSMGRDFSMTAVALSWVVTAYALAAAVFLLPAGRLADIRGRRRVFLTGASIYTLASLAAGLAPSGAALILARAVQGAGAAMIFGTNAAILTSVFPLGQRGRVLGLNVAAVYVGLTCGPYIGGVLTEYAGWRSVFLINVPLGILVIFVILRWLRHEWAEAHGEYFDLFGAVIYAAALVALMLGASDMRNGGGAALMAAGAAIFASFIVWELRARSPLVEIRLFRDNVVFALSNLAALLNYSAMFAVGFLLNLHFQFISGLKPTAAGLVLIAQPLVMAMVSPLAGRLSDRVEPRIVASIGMGLTTVGLAAFAALSETTPLAAIVAALAILGLGMALFSSPNANAIMSSVEKRRLGLASAMMGTMRLTGQMVSMAIVMLALSVFVGDKELTAEAHDGLLPGLRLAFAASAALCLAGVFASLARGRLRAQNECPRP